MGIRRLLSTEAHTPTGNPGVCWVIKNTLARCNLRPLQWLHGFVIACPSKDPPHACAKKNPGHLGQAEAAETLC
jgi:hypothetical protein